MAQAKWLVLVDWSGNGGFPVAAVDVSEDVIDLTLEHFRDLRTGYVESARAELKLRNEDHRYSPPNARSPLHPHLKPGRALLIRAAYPHDGFTSSPAGTRLSGHSPELGPEFRWTEGGRGFRIASGGGAAETDGSSGAGTRLATLDLGSTDVSFGCEFRRGQNATSHGGLCLRYADASNFLYVRVTGQALELRKVETGRHATVAAAPYAWSASERRFLQVVTHGESVRVFVDDRQVIDASTSFNSGHTRHGLFCSGDADHAWRAFGGWVSLFRGVVDTIHPRPRFGAQYCYVRALDDMERLTSVTLHTQATSAYPQTSDEILGDVLDRSGAEAGRRMDAGAELVPRLWSPPLWGVQALDTIYRLQDEEDGLIYVDGHGLWRLESREHRDSAPHTAHTAIIEDVDRGGNAYFSELVWDDGVDNVENTVFMHVRGATFHGANVAWTLSEKPYFAARETKLFLAESSEYDMIIGQLRSRRNTDYAAHSRQDGTGTNLTSQLTVRYPSQREYRGKGTLVSVTFSATAGYLTKLQIRTLNAYTFDDPVIVRSEDSASVAEYGRRAKRIDAIWTREAATAQAAIDSRMRRRKRPHSVATLVLNNGSGGNLAAMLQRGFSDRVRLRYPSMGIDADFFIEGRKLSVAEGWTRVECEMLLQSVD